MKTSIITFTILISVSAFAGPRDEVPGGVHADAYFYKQWENMVKPQRFPLLPKASEIPVPDPKLGHDKPRYIFHLDTSAVKVKDSSYEKSDNYYHFLYSSKEFGLVVLAVHPKYRECFDDVEKKFDQMQWVVYVYTEHDFSKELGSKFSSVKELVLEKPRQCLGAFKYTGSKLPDAKGALDE